MDANKKKPKPYALLVLAIIICLTSAIGANALQTSGGTVKVRDLAIEIDGGTLSLVIFRPDSATVQNPAPAVIASHGMFNSKEMQDIACVELARRGIVVISMDMVAHGLSENFDSSKYVTNNEGQYYNVDQGLFVDNKADATNFDAHGMIDVVEYVWKTLNFVDRNRIGVTGHSMGGVNSTLTTKYYHYVSTVGGGESKVNAALMQSCNEAVLPGEFDGVNIGFVNGLYDEMFSLPLPAFAEMGITTVPELNQFQADTFVREHAGYTEPYEFGTIVYDQDGMIRVYNSFEVDHPFVHFSTKTAEAMVTFFTKSFGIEGSIPATNQIWLVKEYFNLIGLIGFFMLIIAFIGLLLRTRFFAPLNKDAASYEQTKLDSPKTKADKVVYILGIVILAVIPGLVYYPFMNLGWFKKSAAFPQTMPNNQVLWMFLVGVILIAYVFGVYNIYVKRKGFTLRNYGLYIRGEGETIKTSAQKMAKTALLGILGIMAGYLMLFMLYYVFKTDFRLFSFAVKTINVEKILILFPYLIFALVWAFGVATAVNTNFRKGMSGTKILAITIIANTLGVAIGLFTYYIPFFANGVPPSSEFINPILLMPMPAIIAIATVFAYKLFKKTGSVYLPTIVNAVLFCFIMVENTHISYPYWFI